MNSLSEFLPLVKKYKEVLYQENTAARLKQDRGPLSSCYALSQSMRAACPGKKRSPVFP